MGKRKRACLASCFSFSSSPSFPNLMEASPFLELMFLVLYSQLAVFVGIVVPYGVEFSGVLS